MDPEKSTTGTGERSRGDISGTVCKYLPAEELINLEIDSLSEISSDDDLFETMSQELLWAQVEDIASVFTFSDWIALDSGKTSPSVEPQSTTKETWSKVTSSFESEPMPIGPMVRKLPNSCVPPGLGKTRALPRSREPQE